MAKLELSKPSTKTKSGIPEAVFLEDVDEYMNQAGVDGAESVIRKLDEMHNKYKFMESNLAERKMRLKNQLPDLKSSLDIIRHMQNRKQNNDAMTTHFQVSSQLYAKASIPPTDKVSLWLGANVMLEYSIDEAESVLQKNHDVAITNLKQVENDLGFLRDQTTTTEVNMARVYNWDVKRRQTTSIKSS